MTIKKPAPQKAMMSRFPFLCHLLLLFSSLLLWKKMSVNTMPNVTISDTQRVVSAMAGSIVTGLVGLGALFWETHMAFL